MSQSSSSSPATRAWRAIAAPAAILLSALWLAPASASDVTPQGSVIVSPTVAPPGVSRTITVNVTWPNACVPGDAVAVPYPPVEPDVLIVRLNELETFAPCAEVLTPITRSVTYTPLVAGTLPVRVMTGTGTPLAEGRLVTRLGTSGSPLAGVWLGSPGDFSIMQLTGTADGRSDGVVGAIHLFAADGTPRWRLLHSSGETAPGVVTLIMSDFTGRISPSCNGPTCPAAEFTGRVEGSVEIETVGADRVQVTVRGPGSIPAPIWFRSVMNRLPL